MTGSPRSPFVASSLVGQPPRSQQVLSLIQAGVAAQRGGDPGGAERFFRQALELDPRNADALQLLGLVAKGRGDLAAAEALMRQSLGSNSRQPHVHHNLGNVLKGQGRFDEALTCYERATSQKPDYTEAYVQRGETLIALERWPEALPLLRRAVQLQPGSISARVALADLLITFNELGEAEAVLRQGLAQAPENLFFLHNLGLTLRLAQRFEEAFPCLRHVVERMPQSKEAWHNLGNVLVALGRLDEAALCYRRVLDLDPMHYNAHDNLNKMLWEMGRHDELMHSFDIAKRHFPDNPTLCQMAAESALAFERLEDAERDIVRADALAPGSLGVARLRTSLLLRRGAVDEAIAVAGRGLETYPTDVDLLRQFAEAALRGGRAAEGLAAARRLRDLRPDSQFAMAYIATALRLLGDPAYRELYDYGRSIRAAELPPPPGYEDIQAFNADLLESLIGLHVMQHEPVNQTLRNGTQTREGLFTRPGAPPPVKLLEQAVLREVDRFRQIMPGDATHPFFRHKETTPLRWAGSWSVRLREEGFHTDHIHPEGWLSGCYYIEVPDATQDSRDKPGWIKFGEPNLGEGSPSLPWEKAVQPRPGLLVLFPSYMWHGTIPFHTQEHRTTVAFDIAVGKAPIMAR